MAKLILQVVNNNQITEIISKEAAFEMEIHEGKEITAVIKATEVVLMEE
ncbi:MAG: hypothetical protein K8R45_03660 [Desulfobacterales bacterium]|nr:hypothetical protein [Desulfobacterales bacterium]